MFNSQTYKLIITTFFILHFISLSGQTQQLSLSRQDSAIIIEYLDKANQHESFNNIKEASRFINNAAMIYWEHNYYDESIRLFEKSLNFNKKLNNENGIAMINSNLALINTDKQNFEEALKYFEKTLAIRKSNNEVVGIISAHINISVVLNRLKKTDEAIKHLHEALNYAREMNDAGQMKSCYGMLSETYEKAGNVEKSLYYYNYYRSFHELVINEKIKKSEAKLENEQLRAVIAETEKEKKELELLLVDKKLKETKENLAVSESENKDLVKNLSRAELEYRFLKNKAGLDNIIAEEKIKKTQRIITYSLIVLAFIVAILVLLFIYSRKIKNKNKTLSYKNIAIQQQREELNESYEEIKTINEELSKKNKKLYVAMEKLKETQMQLVQSEKMASLGLLTAGIAHEINNPVNFIFTGVNSLQNDFKDIDIVLKEIDKLSPGSENLKEKIEKIQKLKKEYYFNDAYDAIYETISDIQTGSERTIEIVKGLRNFSRADKGDWVLADIHEGIEASLLLLKSKYKNRIKLIKNYDETLPFIECLPGKLNQALLNVINNAIDAIPKKGFIKIITIWVKSYIFVHIKDSGSGISSEIKDHIFEPFYTTKEVGKGVGLGLSITYGIIKDHNGDISLESELGKGTEFIIKLPVKQLTA